MMLSEQEMALCMHDAIKNYMLENPEAIDYAMAVGHLSIVDEFFINKEFEWLVAGKIAENELKRIMHV